MSARPRFILPTLDSENARVDRSMVLALDVLLHAHRGASQGAEIQAAWLRFSTFLAPVVRNLDRLIAYTDPNGQYTLGRSPEGHFDAVKERERILQLREFVRPPKRRKRIRQTRKAA